MAAPSFRRSNASHTRCYLPCLRIGSTRRPQESPSGYSNLASFLLDEPDNCVHIVNCDGAFEPDGSTAVLRAMMHCAVDTRVTLVARCDHEEVGRAPRCEAPFEHAFVELARTRHIIRVNIEVRDVFRDHWRTSSELCQS